jgi:hypothetical protein
VIAAAEVAERDARPSVGSSHLVIQTLEMPKMMEMRYETVELVAAVVIDSRRQIAELQEAEVLLALLWE